MPQPAKKLRSFIPALLKSYVPQPAGGAQHFTPHEIDVNTRVVALLLVSTQVTQYLVFELLYLSRLILSRVTWWLASQPEERRILLTKYQCKLAPAGSPGP